MDTGRIQGDHEGNVVGATNCYGGPWCFFYQYLKCFYQYVTTPMNVRYIYAAFFIVAIALAWGARENPQAFFRGQSFGSCEDDLDCLTVEAVLIVSLTSFLFFLFMSISTMYTRTVHSRRNSWHTQWWLPKMLLAASCLAFSILGPAGLTELYGRLAHLGAGVLLFIQLITIIRYITRLNSIWCQANTGGDHYLNVNYLNVNTVSILAYSASLIWIATMFHYAGCNLNIVLISSTMFMVFLMPIISQLSEAWGWYMEPGLMGLYIVFLCWSAIKSQPDSICNKKVKPGSSSKSWEIISFVVGLFSIVVATFSTGNEYKSIQFKNVPESENGGIPPYGYGLFHLAFALGSMYFGMLLLGWDTYHASKKWSIDVSWTSMWIHIANEVLAAIFFIAVVLARIYGTDSLRQFLGRMFGIGGQQHGDQSNATETDTSQPPAASLPPTAEQHGDQSPATETDTGRPTSSLTPTTTEIHVDLSTIQ